MALGASIGALSLLSNTAAGPSRQWMRPPSLPLKSGYHTAENQGTFTSGVASFQVKLCDEEASEHLEQPTVFNHETFPGVVCA